MTSRKQLKADVMKKLKGFDKPSHAKSLAEGIMRTCKDPDSLPLRIQSANNVVSAIRADGVSSFFAAEYAKVFITPEEAITERDALITLYKNHHALTRNQATKMAECIVFSAAKGHDIDALWKMNQLCHESLSKGVPFQVVVDVVYYTTPNTTSAEFAKRCVATSIRKNKPMDVSQVDLSQHLTQACSS